LNTYLLGKYPIAPSSNRKRGDRRARQNKSPNEVVSLTPQQSFETQLARHTDATPIRGKLLGNSAALAAGVPSVLFLIQPSTLGSRVSSIASDYLRYRIKWLRIRFLGNVPTTANTQVATTAIGILDDIGYSGEPPTTVSGITELRCSATQFTNETVPTILEFRPIDKKKWYYCNAPSNDRFDSVATVYGGSTVAGSVAYEIDYCVVFAGAFTTGAL